MANTGFDYSNLTKNPDYSVFNKSKSMMRQVSLYDEAQATVQKHGLYIPGMEKVKVPWNIAVSWANNGPAMKVFDLMSAYLIKRRHRVKDTRFVGHYKALDAYVTGSTGWLVFTKRLKQAIAWLDNVSDQVNKVYYSQLQ